DWDGDGDLDIFNMKDSAEPRIQVNSGGGSFTSTISGASSGMTTIAIDVGDVTGNGFPDMIVAGTGALAYYGNTGGAFTTSVYIDTAGSYGSVVMGDFNGDGWLDVLGTLFTGNGRLFLNNGAGSFLGVIDIAGLNNIDSMTPGDVDNDGDIDIVCGAGNMRQSFVLINDGNANFTAGKQFGTTPVADHDNDLGDWDGDGDLDYYAMRNGGQDQIYLNDGTGQFGSPLNVGAANENGITVEFADFNGDGALDIVRGNQLGTGSRVEFGNGSGSISYGINLPDSSTEYLVAAGDFDGDGDLDIVSQGNSTSRMISNGGLVLSPASLNPARNSASALNSSNVTAQFTGYTMAGASQSTFIVHGGNTGRRAGTGINSGDTAGLDPSADFHANERILVTVTSGVTASGAPLAPFSYEFRGRVSPGPGVWDSFSRLDTRSNTLTGAYSNPLVGDFNGDGTLDLFGRAADNSGTDRLRLRSNLGESGQMLFTSLGFNTPGASEFTIGAYDFDNDGDLDVISGANGGVIRFLENTGTGAMNDDGTNATVNLASAANAFADFDNDGDIDFVLAQAGSNAMDIYENTSTT
ncbi:MAG: VCBS repeat-containing protein, partial [Planctomycetes bacterium]|nr:VCBS repeat-containing protein [Planctomycetota bacterium]